MNKEIDLIIEFEKDCMNMAQPIITKLCKRAMHSMNKKTADYFTNEDYPKSFTFIDILSIKIQNDLLDDINPYLEDYLNNTLNVEFDKLSPQERLIIAYCDCSENLQSKYFGCQPKIYDNFRKMLDEHYYTNKVQHFVNKAL